MKKFTTILVLMFFLLGLNVYSTEVKVVNTAQYAVWHTHIWQIEGTKLAAVKFNSGPSGTYLVRFSPVINANQGTVSGNLTVKLWTVGSDGKPTSPTVVYGPVDVANYSLVGEGKTVTFQLNKALTANTDYYISLEKTGGASEVGWYHDESNFGPPPFDPNPATPVAYRSIRTPMMKSTDGGTTWSEYAVVITMVDVVVANTEPVAPTVTLGAATLITTTSAKLWGNLTANGSNNCTQKGVCWGTTASPTTANSSGLANNPSTTGSYGVVISPTNSLTPGTLYYYRPFATSLNGTSYSATDGTFRTTAADLTANPASFTATRASSTSINLSFSAPNTITNCKGYIIIARADGWGELNELKD